MSDFILYFIIFAVVSFLLLILFYKRSSSGNNSLKLKLKRDLLQINKKTPLEQVLELDKILDKCLSLNKLRGTMGEKMKKYGNKFQNTRNIWNAHKLRNRIAHELNFKPSRDLLLEAKKHYLLEINYFLK